MVLAGDIGGTNVRLGSFDPDRRPLRPSCLRVYPSREFGGLTEVIERYLEEFHLTVDAACFAIAGPVVQGRVKTSNLPWQIAAKDLARQLDLPQVRLINDLEGCAHGLMELTPEDFVVLNTGDPHPDGNAAIIAAGTGLGEAGLFFEGDELHPFPSEGGHTDFAPRNRLEIDLLLYLMEEFGSVSVERVLSGPGLHNIYRFLRDTGYGKEPSWLRERLQSDDPPSVISQAGLDGTSELCSQALDLFVAIYGAEAGNLALTVLATRGVYVAGGIAPKILTKLLEPTFLEAFVGKGRMQALLQSIPVSVIKEDQAPLIGAARVAALGIPGFGRDLRSRI